MGKRRFLWKFGLSCQKFVPKIKFTDGIEVARRDAQAAAERLEARLREVEYANTIASGSEARIEPKRVLALQKLIAGIVDFRERMLPQYAQRFKELALSQTPDVLFVTCSDSRVVPDLLASTHPGDLFTMRNVGNLIPPATADGISIGDLSEASAIEYSVLVLSVANIVVCGHSECGAMKAVMANQPTARDPKPDQVASPRGGVPAGARGRARCEVEAARSTLATQCVGAT